MHPSSSATFARLRPKICGGDLELGNFITGLTTPEGTGYEASRLLLHAIDGRPGFTSTADELGAVLHWAEHPERAPARPDADGTAPGALSQDSGRKYLRNGGCIYIDLNHLEVCLPEVRSARDHVAHTHALYRLAQAAAVSTNARLSGGHRVVVLANNSDGHGERANSYGSHLNLLVHRHTWESICHRRLLHQGFLAAYQVSSLVFTGLGKVGADHLAPPVSYQISQRADFIETLSSHHTTMRRPVINIRDEPLCGRSALRYRAEPGDVADLARLHVITYDHNLCHVAGFLKVGVLQIVLAMLEADWTDSELLLDDPIGAMTTWSHDPMLRARARHWSGSETTAVDLQLRFHELAQRFVATGACAENIPEADEILRLWGDTLRKLQTRDFDSLRRRLDWVLKLSILSQALRQRPDLSWDSPELQHLDQLYSNLDPAAGLYFSYEKRGLVDRMVSDEDVARAMSEPPTDTRAWTRGRLLQLAQPGDVDLIDWDFIRFKLEHPTRRVARYFTVDLPDPRRATAADNGAPLAGASDLRTALAALGATETRPVISTSWSGPPPSAAAYDFSVPLSHHQRNAN